MTAETYNQRLFSRGLRKYFHEARFFWLRAAVQRHAPAAKSVVELGCFDAKTIHYLPAVPQRYLGLDANWEGGLDIAKQTWGEKPNYHFIESSNPMDLNLAGASFEIGICMETLEHMSPVVTSQSLEILAEVVEDKIFITVPNEIGLLFLTKYLVKMLIRSPRESYTIQELFSATLGHTERIERQEHKGFNYKELIVEISDYFEVINVKGIPFPWLPLDLNPTIGIVAGSSS